MKMTIGARILLGYGTLVALTLAVGVCAFVQLGQVNEVTTRISHHDLALIHAAHDIVSWRDGMRDARQRDPSQALAARSNPGRTPDTSFEEQWRRNRAATAILLAGLAATAREFATQKLSAEHAARWRRVGQLTGEAQQELETQAAEVAHGFRAAEAGGTTTALGTQEANQHLQAFTQRVDDIEDAVNEVVQLGKTVGEETYASARVTLLVALALALLLGACVGLTMYRSVARPLAACMSLLEGSGRRDLTRAATADRNNELYHLGRSLSAMVEGLRNVASQTRSATESLSASAAQILASTQQHVGPTSQQVGAMQQTTTAVNETGQSRRQVTRRARRVARPARAAASGGKAGRRALADISRAMEAIREQAQMVASTVVTLSEMTQALPEIVVDATDIAEQSNLFALNAAVEAAAAGEQGRSRLGQIQKGVNTSVVLTEEAVKRVDAASAQVALAARTIAELAASVASCVNDFQQMVAAPRKTYQAPRIVWLGSAQELLDQSSPCSSACRFAGQTPPASRRRDEP